VPFAELQVGTFFIAFRGWSRQAGDFESVMIRDDRLHVEGRMKGVLRFDATRCWA